MARRISGFTGLAAVHLTATAAIGVTALAPASAQETFDLEVKASVANVCIVTSNGGLDFGELTLGQSKTAATILNISCTFAVNNATIDINHGLNFDNEVGRRLQLDDTGLFIVYDLCLAEPSGDACASWEQQSINIPAPGGTSINLHALIPSTATNGIAQDGEYKDTLQVELFL